jgi:hypothetical protein
MRDNLAEAQRCRERAEHLRMLAARNEIVQIQDALLAVARDYEGWHRSICAGHSKKAA